MSKMIFSSWTQNETFRAAFPHTTELNCPQKNKTKPEAGQKSIIKYVF